MGETCNRQRPHMSPVVSAHTVARHRVAIVALFQLQAVPVAASIDVHVFDTCPCTRQDGVQSVDSLLRSAAERPQGSVKGHRPRTFATRFAVCKPLAREPLELAPQAEVVPSLRRLRLPPSWLQHKHGHH